MMKECEEKQEPGVVFVVYSGPLEAEYRLEAVTRFAATAKRLSRGKTRNYKAVPVIETGDKREAILIDELFPVAMNDEDRELDGYMQQKAAVIKKARDAGLTSEELELLALKLD